MEGVSSRGPGGAPGPLTRLRRLLPGLGLCLLLALASVLLRRASGIAALNPVVIALLAGLALRAGLGRRAPLDPGIAFAIRPMLRFAIVLLGLQVTLTEVLALGPGALALAVAVVAVTVPAAAWLGARMGVPQPLALLLGMGTGICGASAIVAANQVVRAKDEDVTYALAVITLCGTLGLVLLPLLAAPLGLDAQSYGLWAGASLHEVVQAVGAAAAGGPEAAQSGTVMKLARVMLLAPAIMALGWWVARQGAAGGTAKVQVPWFALGFLGLVLLGSTGLVPAVATEASRLLVPLLMAASVAALGLATDLRALGRRGLRPLGLGVLLSLLIAGLALAGVLLLGL
ncbi:putative sulfate exporter family transporter [Roseomonas sp. BU-1]|uniref:Sulfate exporter family transporter n=1 Tax=Falsiroseomonas selenitidurans TaxID=2716335 RepID=A0ABX1E4C9_9PROT|nr:putative sulfate exporter family transporter [Falsiroseomonas selenitidurans]